MDTRPLEYNVICVKWGDKFTAEHVNRLYRMAKRNITLPFNFYCYTENPNGILEEVNIVPLDESLNLEKWWWKVTLFKNNKRKGINLYLDLDVVIQHNINELFKQTEPNKLALIHYNGTYDSTFSDPPDIDFKTSPYYNSSIMIWYNNDHNEIYEKFIKNMNVYLKVYLGMDRFLSYEVNPNRLVEIENRFFYHRLSVCDYDLHENEVQNFKSSILRRKTSIGSYDVTAYFNDKRNVCIFNGCHEPEFYDGFERFLL